MIARPLVLATALAIVCAPTFAAAYEWAYLGLDGVATTCIGADPHHQRVLVGTHEGFRYYDTPTGAWTERDDEGSIGRQVCALQWFPGDDQRLITGRENAFGKGYLELTDDLGLTHEIVHTSQGGRFVDLDFDGTFLYACSLSDITPGEFLRSPDGGATWTLLSGHGHTAMSAIAVGEIGDLYVAGDGLVSLSLDHGDSWAPIGAGLAPTPQVTGLLATGTEGDVVDVVVVAATEAALYAARYPVWEWTPVLLEDCRRLALIRMPAPWPLNQLVRIVAITQDDRVLVADSSCEWWEDQTGDLPGTPVDAAFSADDGGLYVCTADDGVYRAQILTAADEPPAVPTASLLVRPNPFNARTTVSFAMPATGLVVAAIYDARGCEVARLVEGALGAGTHRCTWNGTDAAGRALASGTYVCRLSTPWGVEVRTVGLVR